MGAQGPFPEANWMWRSWLENDDYDNSEEMFQEWPQDVEINNDEYIVHQETQNEETRGQDKSQRRTVTCSYLDFKLAAWVPCEKMCPLCGKFGKYSRKCRENDCYCCDH